MEHSVSGIGVLDKAVLIISALNPLPATLAELVERTELARPTAFRLAKGLVAHGYLRQDEDGRFALGGALVGLGRAATEGYPLHAVAAPELERLRDETGESVQLYVPDGGERLCLMALDSLHELRTIVAPGARLPLGRGSAGRILSGEDTAGRGWIETVEEREKGVASVSAPVLGHDGTPVAAFSVSGPIGRLGRSPGSRHGLAVVSAAESISAKLV